MDRLEQSCYPGNGRQLLRWDRCSLFFLWIGVMGLGGGEFLPDETFSFSF